jgi:hypothetical protein
VKLVSRETREGWPLLTAQTKANGDSWSTHERGPTLAGSLGWSLLSCLGCFGQPSTKYYLPHRTLFHRAGSRAGSPVSVSLRVSLLIGMNIEQAVGCLGSFLPTSKLNCHRLPSFQNITLIPFDIYV